MAAELGFETSDTSQRFQVLPLHHSAYAISLIRRYRHVPSAPPFTTRASYGRWVRSARSSFRDPTPNAAGVPEPVDSVSCKSVGLKKEA